MLPRSLGHTVTGDPTAFNPQPPSDWKRLHVWEAVALPAADPQFPRFTFPFSVGISTIGHQHAQQFSSEQRPTLVMFEKISTNAQDRHLSFSSHSFK